MQVEKNFNIFYKKDKGEIKPKKQFTKGKLPCGLSEDTIRKYSNKETEKLFKEVDEKDAEKALFEAIENE